MSGKVRGAAHKSLFTALLVVLAPTLRLSATSITLAWDPSADPNVVGYNLYYGAASRSYTNVLDNGGATSASLTNLAPGTTYYFAATTYTAAGLESAYSAETTYGVPVAPQPPTLDPVGDVTINENSGLQSVTLSGISAGGTNTFANLTVSAFSSNPALIPNPAVAYSSPGSTGSLSFAPTPNSFGSAMVTVMVDNGGSVSNTVIRSFNVIVNPVNVPPTLDSLTDLTLNENTGPQTVNLSGIGPGDTNQPQTFTITAASSNPGLIPNPAVSYSSPNATGTLTLAPTANAFGSATISVTVDDGQPTNNTTTRAFAVTVVQTVPGPSVLTNATILPNSYFKFALFPPFTNGDKITYSLDASAPAGAKVVTKKGISNLVWSPSNAQASTTNLITIHINDNANPSLNTNVAVMVTVLDFLAPVAGSVSVQAGQSTTLPLYLSSSEGVTNLAFTVCWPSNRFSLPTLFNAAPGIASSSLQSQGTNVLISLQTGPGQALQGSNLIARLSFQAVSNQASAFVKLPVAIVGGTKPSGASYSNFAPQPGRVVVVSNLSLLEALADPVAGRNLTLYGKVGTTYQLQSSTNLTPPGSWSPVVTLTLTNVAQTVTADPNAPFVLYRLLQQ